MFLTRVSPKWDMRTRENRVNKELSIKKISEKQEGENSKVEADTNVNSYPALLFSKKCHIVPSEAVSSFSISCTVA